VLTTFNVLLRAHTGVEDIIVGVPAAKRDCVKTMLREPNVQTIAEKLRNTARPAFNIPIYWPSGYLCAQLTISFTNPHLRIDRGPGAVEFHCPELEIQPGSYRVDISIQSNGVCINRQQRCSILRVHPGKRAFGDFYINAFCRVMS
jgi:hypothetical protein